MSAHAHASAPVKRPFFTPGVFILMGVAALGFIAAASRFVFGLDSTTNLTNDYPWGLWIAVDVASGVALAAGGFTTAALAHIFHRSRYEVLVRPALLTAMLGYTFVALGLLVDLGRYYNIWHPLWPGMWQGNSVLFEVAMCVTIYLTVLYLEFVPIVCERFAGKVNLPGMLASMNKPLDKLLYFLNRTVTKIMFLLVIAGVVLSFMHQSSLGSLLLIAPTKMHALWYTPVLPLLFLLSALMVGYPMVIFESMYASKSFGRKPEMEALGPLGRIMLLFVGVYLIAKVSDVVARDVLHLVFAGDYASWLWLAEVGLCVALPFFMLMSRYVRRSPILLFSSAALVVGGVVFNRINVFIVAYKPLRADSVYVPSVAEVLVTAGLVATLVLIYRAFVTIFPVLPAEAPEDMSDDPAEERPEPVQSGVTVA